MPVLQTFCEFLYPSSMKVIGITKSRFSRRVHCRRGHCVKGTTVEGMTVYVTESKGSLCRRCHCVEGVTV